MQLARWIAAAALIGAIGLPATATATPPTAGNSYGVYTEPSPKAPPLSASKRFVDRLTRKHGIAPLPQASIARGVTLTDGHPRAASNRRLGVSIGPALRAGATGGSDNPSDLLLVVAALLVTAGAVLAAKRTAPANSEG